MKALILTLSLVAAVSTVRATESDIAQAESNPSAITTLVLNGSTNEAKRLLNLAPKLTALQTVVFQGYTDDAQAGNSVASVAACNKVREIIFRNCTMAKLPANLRMLTQVKTFTAENTVVSDGEQFYNAIADMANVENVNVTGTDFRSLPRSFSRLRVMKNISLINQDLQLATGYDLNTKTPEELVARDSVQFGFGEDVLNLAYSCYNADACKAHLQMFRDVLQGAYRQSNTFYTPLQGKIFRKKHPLVKPPVAGVDVYPDLYSYSALTGTTAEYGSGTKITIPPMAFEDANGSPVTGNVDITYREFRDPVDILLSGIPMKYDSAGTTGDFESAGMFEINASQNGTEVYLQEGKKISIDFAVVDTASSYNFYRLDERNGWQYLENTGAVEQEKVPVVDTTARAPWSAAMTYYVSKIGEAGRTDKIGDTTSFAGRYADTAYIGSRKYKGSDVYYWKDKRKQSSKLYLRKYYSGDDYTLVKVAHAKSYSGGNPELGVYSSYYWKIKGKYTSPQLKQEYGRNTGMNDVRVINENGTYYLEMKYYWGFKRLEAEPVTVDSHHKPVEVSDKQKEKLFGRYTSQLNRRGGKVDRENAREIKRHNKVLARAQNDSTSVYERTRKFMDDSEEAMDYKSWLDYTTAERTRLMTAQEIAWQSNGKVYQALTVAGMGVFNCDQVRRLEKPKTSVAAKVKVASLAFVPFIVYVIDRARNMVLTYTGNGGNGVQYSYGSNASNQLLSVDGNGALYMSNEEQFTRRAPGEGGDEFEGTMISGPNSTPETIREAVFGKSPEAQDQR